MAQQMCLKGRPFAAGSVAPRRRVVAVRASAVREDKPSIAQRVTPSLLAALVALSGSMTTVDAVYAPSARAEDEETMTPYQKRQAELEKRRELLREAREKAAARAAGTPYAPSQPAATPEPEKPAAPVAPSLSYKAATQNRPSLPAPEPAKEAPSLPSFGGFSFGKPAAPPAPAAPAPAPAPAPEPAKPKAAEEKKAASDDMGSLFSSDMWNTPIKPKSAPAEAPAAPTPAPAPQPAVPAPSFFKGPEPAPVKKAPEPAPVKKAAPASAPAPVKQQAAAKPGKRRGPLPLWFAEVLVLGAYAGVFLAVTKYSKQSSEVLAAVWAKVVEAYNALEKLVNKKGQAA